MKILKWEELMRREIAKRDKQIKRLYRAGVNLRDIGAKFGISKQRAHFIARRVGR